MILSRKRSDCRDRRLCRFGVMLVVCSLLVNMVCVPKAKAVVIDASAAFGAAAATAAINGTTATTLFTGMTTSAATTAMTGLMGEYAVATGAASSGTALAASIGAGTVITAAGAIVLTAAAAFAVYKFIEWLREEKGLEAGGNLAPLYSSAFLGDYPVTEIGLGDVSVLTNTGSMVITLESFTSPVYTFNGYSYNSNYPPKPHFYSGFLFSSAPFKCTYPVNSYGNFYVCSVGGSKNSKLKNHDSFVQLPDVPSSGISGLFDQIFSLPSVSEDLILEPNSEFQIIPQEIPDGQAMVISGIENLPQADPQAAADLIMQTAIDGNLSPTVTVEADPTATPDPEPEPSPDPEPEPSPDPDPDAPELPSNLGDLGAALTTRFPFSIPWDIARAIKLIAAPAQAPYWEVDFLAPMAHWVGGFSGSTKVVLDFGKPEYEIIGIASRWTSTIGFCLALAAATKRFIWTA